MNVNTFDRSAYLAATLLVVTVCAMMTQYISNTEVLNFRELPPEQIRVYDNSDEAGESIARLKYPTSDTEPLVLTCEIKNNDENSSLGKHFCRVALVFAEGEQGLDLSNFDSFSLWIKYEKATMQGIRFLTRNYHPQYSKIEDSDSLKYNIVEITPEINPYPIRVPFQSFQVPPWWLTSEKLSHEHGIPEFNNIHRIDVFTGFSMPPGTYTIIIEKIAVTGKWVNIDTVYLMLLIFWILVGLMYLLSHLKVFAFFFERNDSSKDVAELMDYIHRKSLVGKPIAAIDPTTGKADSQSLATLLHEFYLGKDSNEISVMIIECDKAIDLEDASNENVLEHCLNIITGNTRDLDTVARWGDSGFVIVLPFTDVIGASQLAEKLRRLVEELELQPCLTVSIGVAALDDTRPQEILDQAIDAVKSAKYQGGNRVITGRPLLVDIVNAMGKQADNADH